jgi:glycosyltransferase involved in cell wall biosynthesis
VLVKRPDAIPAETIRQWHEAGAVRLMGHVGDVSGLLAEVEVLAVPTFYPEGIPRILLEGAAAGFGLVASDTDGCREVVDHGRNGLLVARRDAVDRFDLAAINDQWVELYRRWLQSGLRGGCASRWPRGTVATQPRRRGRLGRCAVVNRHRGVTGRGRRCHQVAALPAAGLR